MSKNRTNSDPHSRKGVTYRPYSPTAMTKAYLCVMNDGMSIRSAAQKFKIPEATLRGRVSGHISPEVTRSGRQPLLSVEEEECFAHHIKIMASSGYGFSRTEVVEMASQYAIALGKRDQDHPFSLMWLHKFMKRWPELKLTKPRLLKLEHAQAVSELAVTVYFTELNKILTKYNLKNSPERLYIMDEKALRLNYSPLMTDSEEDSNDDIPTADHLKEDTVTVIGCGNAIGQQIPPFIIFPGNKMGQEMLAGATPGTDGTVSPTGQTDVDIYMNYLTSHFTKFAQNKSEDKPLLVLYDGHRPQISLPLIDWAQDQNIHFFILPAHTSHVLEPHDIGCFGPFEQIYREECSTFMTKHLYGRVDKHCVGRVVCSAYSKSLSPTHLVDTFQKTGIFEFNPSVVNKYVSQDSVKVKVAEMPVFKPDPNTESMSGYTASVKRKHIKQKETSKKPKITITLSKSKPSSVKYKKTKITSSKPGANTNKPVPIRVPMVQSADIDTSDDDDIADEEKCCQCGKYQPVELTGCNSVYFTKWGQCMFQDCLHWTHLQFCCDILRLSAKDTFYCPCHGTPCDFVKGNTK